MNMDLREENERLLQQARERARVRRDQNLGPVRNDVLKNIVRGKVIVEDLRMDEVLKRIEEREKQKPTKEVTLRRRGPDGEIVKEIRQQRETNLFITIQTNQEPPRGKEDEYNAIFKIVLNKLFTDPDMAKWIKIRQPFLGKGDIWSVSDLNSEYSVVHSMDISVGLEYSPTLHRLHAHAIVMIKHYTFVQFHKFLLGQLAAELWREFFPEHFPVDPTKNILLADVRRRYNAEKDAGVILANGAVDLLRFYAQERRTRVTFDMSGIPVRKANRKGLDYYSLPALNKILVFYNIKSSAQGGLPKKLIALRTYIQNHEDEVQQDAENNEIIQHMPQMYIDVQIMPTTLQNSRMNYLAKGNLQITDV
jgi:hypothetical protein